MRSSRFSTALVLALALGCSSAPESPEAAVRATLAAIETAARARDVGVLREQVSEAYADAQGNDRRQVMAVATAHFMRNQAVYTLSRIAELEVSEPGRAKARVLAALAGRPIPDARALAQVRADLYEFDVALREEEPGVWRVTSAEWRRAGLADFR